MVNRPRPLTYEQGMTLMASDILDYASYGTRIPEEAIEIIKKANSRLYEIIKQELGL